MLLVKLPGLFVVCTVSVWIYILSDTNGLMVIYACSAHLELSDAGIVLPQRLHGSHPLLENIDISVSLPHNFKLMSELLSDVCCCLRHHCGLTAPASLSCYMNPQK